VLLRHKSCTTFSDSRELQQSKTSQNGLETVEDRHEAVKALVTKMKGETVPTVIDSGAAVITQENLDTPEIQALLASFFAVFA
jgi:hypothetical protein